MLKILPYLKLAVERGASDIFFTPSAPAMLKINGEMIAVGRTLMTADFIEELAFSILTPDQQEYLKKHLELDMATQAGGLGRFRVNLFHQRGQIAMVMRHVKSEIPRVDELGLPEVLNELVMLKRGLVLMVGATGSGKTTSLSAMLQHRNESMSGHILTIEDPIEYVHVNKRSIVNQREVGSDTVSYERALVSAMREAPDVILVGEIRTRETMDAAFQLANTGHLALSTLHANNAYQALLRIVNLYPQELRDQLYMDLSQTMRGIVSQRLVRARAGGRVPAVEVLINTPYVSELILSRRIDEIRENLQQSKERGMQSFDTSLYELYKAGKIDLDTALSNADSRANLEARINFGG